MSQKMGVLTLEVGEELGLGFLGSKAKHHDLESVDCVDLEVNFLSQHFFLKQFNSVWFVHL